MPIHSLLLDAAEDHFARRGVLATRLADIRQEAGVSVGAVYHHFPNKEELYLQVWLRALADYQDGFRAALAECADARSGVEGAVVRHLQWVSGNPQRATQQPTAERLLRAFADITWYQVSDGQTTWEYVTPLSHLQRRILALLGIPEAVYTRLAQPALTSPPL